MSVSSPLFFSRSEKTICRAYFTAAGSNGKTVIDQKDSGWLVLSQGLFVKITTS